jgi:3-deoxy-D-manno-octulosonic-acid transferase
MTGENEDPVRSVTAGASPGARTTGASLGARAETADGIPDGAPAATPPAAVARDAAAQGSMRDTVGGTARERPHATASLLATSWSVAATLLAPMLRLNLRRRAANGREVAARLPERRGIDPTPRPAGPLLWMHAASVGETMSILPVLEALQHRAKVLLTTGTATSQALLDQRIPEQGLSGDVLHRFAPLDVPSWVGRFLSHWRPDAACFVESELWPNQIAACQAMGIPLMLVNARMSNRSFGHWRYVPGLARHVLGGFTRVQARGEQDAERLKALGARRVESPGDLKFAAPPLPVDEADLGRLRKILGDRPVWLAASTHPGEEALIAATHAELARLYPALLTIIAPRHPGRGATLAALFDAPRRAAGQDPTARAGIWIADTMGELGLWYRLAPIAFVGRSLVAPGGGQNPLEPARLGCAIAVGPHTGNFSDHVALLHGAGGLVQVADAPALARFVSAMLDNPDQRRRLGEHAAAVVRRHADLPARTADALLSLLPARNAGA